MELLQAQSQDCVFFTHFLVINAVVSAVQEQQATVQFWPDNGSITHLRISDGQLALVALGRDLKTVVN